MDDKLKQVLDAELKDNGKRFSTYYEAHGRVVELVKYMAELNHGVMAQVDTLVECLTYSDVGEDYKAAWSRLNVLAESAINAFTELQAIYIKLQGGVIHEPKSSNSTETGQALR